ncbi:uncharacterized protein EHS24_006906 [Apiotrichum porosum]|uniref:Uncharacterized protein n=1 Tax=Apiotrichum porosum TaxID=105984 RepID=A0A427XWJ4_9TREE|nr:uncharacterized protein EHS24_006906 [Apiotrichum porosum]RSH83239.1 hypothetical protein EHS24_006906 [Apiotrichum porosum]
MAIVTIFHLGSEVAHDVLSAAHDAVFQCLTSALHNKFCLRTQEGRYTSRFSIATFDFLEQDVEAEIKTVLSRHCHCRPSMSYD